MTEELFLQMMNIFNLMKAGKYIAALDRMTALVNATRNHNLDYDPEWEKEAK